MGWQVWRTIGKREEKYLDATDKKHAEKLAKHHTAISIYPYYAKELPDPRLPDTWHECEACGHQWRKAGVTSSACPICGDKHWHSIDGPSPLLPQPSDPFPGETEVDVTVDRAGRAIGTAISGDGDPHIPDVSPDVTHAEHLRDIADRVEDDDPDSFDNSGSLDNDETSRFATDLPDDPPDDRTEEQQIAEGKYTYAGATDYYRQRFAPCPVTGMACEYPVRCPGTCRKSGTAGNSLESVFGTGDALPYTQGSETSKEAAQDAAGSAAAQKARIWQWLHDHGPHQFEEITEGLGIYNNSVSTRLTQMRDDGMIRHHVPEGSADGMPATRNTHQGSAAALYEALDPPWLPVPRQPRGKRQRYVSIMGAALAQIIAEPDRAVVIARDALTACGYEETVI